MIYLRCPKCRDITAVDDFEGCLLVVEDGELELFVQEHLPHLDDDDFLEVIESAGDC